MEKILHRIKNFRKERGYSYETMAHELNISPATYRKLEKNETKLTVERLYQIAHVLETKMEVILDITLDKINSQEVNHNGIAYDNIAYFFSENNEKIAKIELLYEERVKEQAGTINQLITIISKNNLL